MTHYLLATYGSHQEGPPPSPEQMREMMQRIIDLEAAMEDADAFVFGGALTGVSEARVAGRRDGTTQVTDGPFAETKEQIGGFYIIEAADDEEANDWAVRVSETIGSSIEVRPFMATGRVADHTPQ